MSFIRQEQFGGVAPKLDPQRLSPQLAQIAHNCLFERANLRALRKPQNTGVTLISGTETVFPYQGSWISYADRMSIARSPVRNDTYERLYISNGIYPMVRSGAGTWRLGLPRPDAPVATAPDVPEDPDNLLEIEDIYYVCTFVDGFGAEGPPSLPSNKITRVRNTDVTVAAPPVPTGNYNLGPGAKIRYYRSNTGTSETAFQYVTETAISTLSFNDTVDNENLQEVLPSTTWTGPPDDDISRWPDGPMQGITLGPNGIMAGYAKKTVYFSEPYLPHAWPTDYAITLRYNIVGVVWIAAGLLVVTEGEAAVIGGTYPASMTVFIPEKSWPCSSGPSLVDMGGWAMYCSPDGLVAVDGTAFQLVTSELADNNWWSNNVPLDGIAGMSEGRYVYFWSKNAGTETGSWIFDPQNGTNALTTADTYSEVAYTDPNDRVLYIKDGTKLAKFDWGATKYTYTWTSKIYSFQGETNFAYLELVAEDYPVNVVIEAADNAWSGMTEKFNANVGTRIQALPDGFAHYHWQFTVSDQQELVFVGLYEDMAEVG